MASSEQAKQLAILSVVVAGGLSAVGDFGKDQLPPLRLAVGVGFAAIVLTGMAEVAPELSAAFSILILLTSIFVWGADGLTAILRLINRNTSPKKVPTS